MAQSCFKRASPKREDLQAKANFIPSSLIFLAVHKLKAVKVEGQSNVSFLQFFYLPFDHSTETLEKHGIMAFQPSDSDFDP